jgi:hypothetical protein
MDTLQGTVCGSHRLFDGCRHDRVCQALHTFYHWQMAAAEASTDSLVFPRPDDFHIHLRDGPEMKSALAREC